MTIKIAQFGLGPIGLETLKLAAQKPWAKIIGGIDINPALAGRSLAELTGVESLRDAKVYRSLDELLVHAKPDVIFHTAVSKIKAAVAQAFMDQKRLEDSLAERLKALVGEIDEARRNLTLKAQIGRLPGSDVARIAMLGPSAKPAKKRR